MATLKTRDGTELYAKIWGKGEPVILIHGWPLSSDTWDAVSLFLAEKGFQVIAYDRRGFGRSDHAGSGYDYDTLADDLSAVIENFVVGNFHLIGFSMGGGEVIRYLSRGNSMRVQSMVLISSIIPYLQQARNNPLGVDKEIFDGMKRSISEDRAAFFTDFFPKFYGNDRIRNPVSSATLDWSTRIAMDAGLLPTLECIDSFSQTDFRPELAKIHCPALLIHGKEDEIVPIDVSSRTAVGMLQEARILEIADAGHGILASHTQSVCNAIYDFLGKGSNNV